MTLVKSPGNYNVVNDIQSSFTINISRLKIHIRLTYLKRKKLAIQIDTVIHDEIYQINMQKIHTKMGILIIIIGFQ